MAAALVGELGLSEVRGAEDGNFWPEGKSVLLSLGLILGMAACARSGETAPDRHVLLVGCTNYDNLPASRNLHGPANDVHLWAQLFADKGFGIPKGRIVTLAEGHGPSWRPTRANILRELDRLGSSPEIGPASQVIIVLSGHGSQQPDQDHDELVDPEPDGLDEIFLPADVGVWDPRTRQVPGALIDDELHHNLQRISDRGALVLLIVDACCSGTISRGNDGEVVRRVAPEDLGIPRAELDEAGRCAAAASRTRGGAGRPDEVGPLDEGRDLANVVALYASRPEEPTIELSYPEAGKPDGEWYGLFTHTLAGVLKRSRERPTYRELVLRANQIYAADGRYFPTRVWREAARSSVSSALADGTGRTSPSPAAMAAAGRSTPGTCTA